MKKNIQSLELVLPNLIFEEKKKVTKLHEIFDLLQVNDKLNRTPTFTFNFNANNNSKTNKTNYYEV